MDKDVLIYEVTVNSGSLLQCMDELHREPNIRIGVRDSEGLYGLTHVSNKECKLTRTDCPFTPDRAVKASFDIDGREVWFVSKGENE